MLLTICIEPPPTSFLNLTSARSGSTPVVSQSIIRPMVPVGASTDAWALRKPFFSPSRSTSCQASVAAAQTGVSRSSMRMGGGVGVGVLPHDAAVCVGVARVAVVRADDRGQFGGAR